MPRNARNEGYSRRHRFARRGSFGNVLRGSRKVRGRFAVVHAASGNDNIARLGIALTRRLVPSAVDRNLVKRLVRETFRRHAAKGSGLDCVVTLRERFEPSHARSIAAEVRGLLDQICNEDSR
ncbi:MAG: ribonuclease P protein component [Usitatibacter sp.]